MLDYATSKMVAFIDIQINASINLTYSNAMGSIGFGRSIITQTPAISNKLTYKNTFKRFIDDLKIYVTIN